ncbi:MAG: alpha/beta hydrolase [Saprospiraceae bacterium]|nr:alpha/beta hydrolase [Saprospiraceae bacterium]
MPTSTFNNKKIHWQETGEGTPVILIHGFCEDSRMYSSFFPFLTDAGYKVIAPDLLGFGLTETHPEASISIQAEMIEYLTNYLGLASPVLIGHSMGGYIALECLQRNNISWAGVGLFHSHPYPDSPETQQKREKGITFIQKNGLKPYLRDFYNYLFPEPFIKAQPQTIQQLKNCSVSYDPQGVITAQKAMQNRADHQNTLETSKVPVLFLLGLLDTLLPKDKLLDQTHLPAIADIQILKHVGHMGAFEAPATCVRIISNFVKFCESNSSVNS